MKKIYVIRHAESQGNAGMVTSSFADISLTDKGRQEAIHFAEGWSIDPELLVVSAFLRTQQTAVPIQERFPDCPIEEWENTHEFVFLDRSKCVGTVEKERGIIAKEYWNRCDPFYRDGPLEETFFEFLARAQDFAKRLQARNENTIIAFSHGQFMRALRLVGGLEKSLHDLPTWKIIILMKKFQKLQDRFHIKNVEIFTLEELIG